MHVGGKNSRYMHCPGYHNGACTWKTTLRRDLAEERILKVIGEEILNDPQLAQRVYEAAAASWQQA
jgi:hypothetical protein